MIASNYFNAGKMNVRIFNTRNEMGKCAGSDAAAKIKQLLKEKNQINVMFAAAPSQNETLKTLCEDPDIDWTKINAFHMDEYIGLDPTHPAGFRNYLSKAIFNKKPFASINYINGNADNPEEEALRYSKLLEKNHLDVCILGIGENGHIAFNDPEVADFRDKYRVKIVDLDERCRQQQVNDGCFKELEEVPRQALSVTIPGLLDADWMYCSVPGRTKAEAVLHVINDDITTKYPATILKTHEHAFLYIDEDAAELL